MVVQIAGSRVGAIFLRQGGMDQLFGSGFSIASGDSNNRDS